MPIVDFPKGPMATPTEEPEVQEPDVGVVDVATNVVRIPIPKKEEGGVNCFECSDCGSGVFHLYDDGEIECANPRCGGVISGIMVVEMGSSEA